MRFGLSFVMALALLPFGVAAEDTAAPRVAWHGDRYVVSFEHDAVDPLSIAWSDGTDAYAVETSRAEGPGGRTHRAHLPSEAIAYTLEGVEYALEPRPGPTETVRVAFVADVGTSPDSAAVWRALEASHPDVVLIGGDLSYAHGDEAKWRRWLDMLAPLSATTPVMVAFGNHERYCEAYRTCAEEASRYAEYFGMPNSPDRYYSFDWGPVSFVALDTEAYHTRGGYNATDPDAQRLFLAERLQAAERTWRVVYFHRPLYSSLEGQVADLVAREDLGPVLDQGAHLVLAGHAHAYERSAQMRAGAVVDRSDGPIAGAGWVHVVSGGGGRSLYDDFDDVPDWSLRRASEFHFLVLDIAEDRADVTAVRPDGSVLDAFSMRQPVDTSSVGSPEDGESGKNATTEPAPRLPSEIIAEASPSTSDSNAETGAGSRPTSGVQLGIVLPVAVLGALLRRLRVHR